MAEQSKEQSKYIRIGAAWNGDYGVSGILDGPMHLAQDAKLKFYLFENKKKKAGSKAPDFNVMIKNEAFNGYTNQPEPQTGGGTKEELPFS